MLLNESRRGSRPRSHGRQVHDRPGATRGRRKSHISGLVWRRPAFLRAQPKRRQLQVLMEPEGSHAGGPDVGRVPGEGRGRQGPGQGPLRPSLARGRRRTWGPSKRIPIEVASAICLTSIWRKNASLYRGLLRFVGWCNFMKSLVTLWDYLDDRRDATTCRARPFVSSRPTSSTSPTRARKAWLVISRASPEKDPTRGQAPQVARHPGRQAEIPLDSGANVDVIINLMLARMSYLPGETDMIIVHDEIVVEFDDRKERRLLHAARRGRPERALGHVTSRVTAGGRLRPASSSTGNST